MEKYISKGNIWFRCTKKGIQELKRNKEDDLKDFNGNDFLHWFEHNIYHLMSGEEFYKYVDSGCIIDYDGTLSEIFIDGYKSNLGLCHAGLRQGKFLVDGETFLKICDNHKVEVNWANK